MLKYTVKRLLQSVITVLVVVAIVFLLIRMLPTDYYFTEDQLMKFTEKQKNEQLLAAGLLDPLPTQLVSYFIKLSRLDFGTSRRIQHGVPVMNLVKQKAPVSVRLGLISLSISFILGIFIGIIQARNKGKLPDHLGTAYTIFVNAVPHLVSYSLILVFGSRVLKLPSLYSTRNVVQSSILPIACMVLTSIAFWALWTRRYMIDEINKDYIKLARMKGLTNKTIMFKHVFRNAFVPLASYLPASVMLTISGSILAERFFSVPGMGPLLIDSVGRYDTNVVQAVVFLYASLSVLGVFLGDILMMLIDPRITLVKKKGVR